MISATAGSKIEWTILDPERYNPKDDMASAKKKSTA